MDASTETPPRGERGRCSCCGVVAVLLLVVLAAAGVGGKWLFDRYNGGLAPVGAGAAQVFEVRSGDSLEQVAGRLEAAGLIRDAEVLRWRAEMREQAGALKAGWYELAPSLSVDEILDVLVEGRVATRRVTFPEGFTLDQMAQRAEAAGFGTAAEYRRLATDEAASFGVAGLPQGASLEGYLFPSTYELPISAAERELIEAQVAQFVKTWQAVAPADPPRPRHELVTIASMIERETQVDDERPRVSGVIANRLKREMKLQIDATVQYARGEHKARLLYRDLEEDSPYNTYRHAGLPPGPIASPGRASLAAALAPESHDYLYYVLAPDNSGRHVFSATSAQHERAVRRRCTASSAAMHLGPARTGGAALPAVAAESLMRSLLTPDIVLPSVTDLTPGVLDRHDIRGVVLDADNTLCPRNRYTLTPTTIAWIEAVVDSGRRLCVLSNSARVRQVATMLAPHEIKSFSLARKPLRSGFRRALAHLGTDAAHTAMVGDQLFTDILGGNAAGMLTVMVKPLSRNDFVLYRAARLLERPLLKLWAPPPLVVETARNESPESAATPAGGGGSEA